MNESQLTTQVKQYLKMKGAYVEKIFGGGYQSAGISDIICCYKGYYIGIELKSPTKKGRASELQRLKIMQVRASNGVAFITDTLEDVKTVLLYIDMYGIDKIEDRLSRIMNNYFD